MTTLGGSSLSAQAPDAQSQSKPPQNSQAQNSQAANIPSQTIQALIEKLGSDEFRQREAASAELLQIGEPALLALAAAEHGSDNETRVRAQAIRQRIEHEKYDLLAKTFMRDPDPTASHGLPGWKSFSSVAGTTRTAKRLFLEMIEKRRIVAMSLEAIDGGPLAPGVFDGLPTDPQQRLWSVIGKTAKDVRYNLYVKGQRPVSGDVLALLVAVAVLDNPPQDLHDAIRSEIQFGGLERFIVQPSSRICIRKLLGKWMLKAPVTMGEEVMVIAHQTQVPEGADMARRILAGPADKEVVAKALLCLAKFGNVGDLDVIDKFVEDMTVLSLEPTIVENEFREERSGPRSLAPGNDPNNPPKYRRLVSDVALVAGLKIGNFDLSQLFPGIRLHEDFGVVEATIGFPVDRPEVREAAVKAWREYRAKAHQPAT